MFRSILYRRAFGVCERVLLALFWVALLLAFSTPALAVMTLLCSLIHEIGHLIGFLAVGRSVRGVRARYDGMRLLPRGVLSYRDEIAIAAAGPGINLFFAAVGGGLYAAIGGIFFFHFSALNLLCALSNLIPIVGYDGGRMLFDAIASRRGEIVAESVCHRISLSLGGATAFLSLYAMRDLDAGYWLFFAFLLSAIGEMKQHLTAIE